MDQTQTIHDIVLLVSSSDNLRRRAQVKAVLLPLRGAAAARTFGAARRPERRMLGFRALHRLRGSTARLCRIRRCHAHVLVPIHQTEPREAR